MKTRRVYSRYKEKTGGNGRIRRNEIIGENQRKALRRERERQAKKRERRERREKEYKNQNNG